MSKEAISPEELKRAEAYIFNGITHGLAAWRQESSSLSPLYSVRDRMTKAAMKEMEVWAERVNCKSV